MCTLGYTPPRPQGSADPEGAKASRAQGWENGCVPSDTHPPTPKDPQTQWAPEQATGHGTGKDANLNEIGTRAPKRMVPQGGPVDGWADVSG